ncbi:MAG: DUF2851 family protein [Bacteroidales bacterium]|nr:DUF2851 family protein [Bacteroidales bacterium]
MNEYFLHFLWRYKLLKIHNLKSTLNEIIEIQSFGQYNQNAGPDFFNCKIKINDTIWAGNIEIHTKSSDWNRHGHQYDSKYDNIILHVVLEDDVPVKRFNGEIIPTLIIKGLFDETLYLNYTKLMESKLGIPCQKHLPDLDPHLLNIWKEKLIVERLNNKLLQIITVFKKYNNDWNKTFYEFLFRNFGFNVNALPFELVSKSLPLSVVEKHKDNLFQIEALLFGQAGFLEHDAEDDYTAQLKSEYHFLKQKFSLTPINSSLWRMSRIRPVNFPHIRIAQLSKLLNTADFLFSKVIESQSVKDYYGLLRISTSPYWESHYSFARESKRKLKKLGVDAADNIVINTFIPFLFAYASEKQLPLLKESALSFLEDVNCEKNAIVNDWVKNSISVKSAYDSQALIELKNNYCNQKKCLNCMIGDYVINHL